MESSDDAESPYYSLIRTLERHERSVRCVAFTHGTSSLTSSSAVQIQYIAAQHSLDSMQQFQYQSHSSVPERDSFAVHNRAVLVK
jgi:hypothetical protein